MTKIETFAEQHRLKVTRDESNDRRTVELPAGHATKPEIHTCPHCGLRLLIDWRDSK